MRRVIDEFMNSIVFVAIAVTVGFVWFIVLSLAVEGRVRW